ncbi:MAG TPA: DUF4388 domain-containing protein [Candidatus Polarisedimenticolia bacterium]|nr:DUF4388 domain-containing protein [Candidatus Polarisedimenticolia bacterium]
MSRKGLEGSLSTMSLPDLLQWASRGQKTGTLLVRDERVAKKIHFLGGLIIGSSSTDPGDYLGQVLLSEGVISEEQLREAMAVQARTKVMLGRLLVQGGLVTEERVAAVLRHKAEETIYSLFLWADGTFEFHEGELPPSEQVRIKVQVEEVLLEGVRRYDTSLKIREILPDNDLVIARTEVPLPADIAGKRFPARIYGLVDGRRTLADIILEAHSSEFNVCQVLYILVQRGYAAVTEARPADARPAGSPTAATPPEVGPVLEAVRACLSRGESEEALALVDGAHEAGVRSTELLALAQEAERYFVERAYRHYLPPTRILVLKRPLESLMNEVLSPAEMFLVTRVNGSWDLRSIVSISPLREVEALRALKRLRERGVIDLVEPPAQARSA